jgi:hypothetical protein
LAHVLLGGLAHQERAAQVHAYDGIPVVGSHLDQHVVAGDTGVVRQRVGSTKLLGHPGHGGLHRVFVGHVDADGQRLTPGCLDLLDDRLAGGLLEVQDGDGEAVVAQPLRDGCSDTTGGPGDDGDTSLVGHGFSLRCEM